MYDRLIIVDGGVLAVIFLSFMLAVGFLLIILSCALWSNWLPLLVGEQHTSSNSWVFRWLTLNPVVLHSFDLRSSTSAECVVRPLYAG